MSSPWWIGVTPAESAVACGPNRHRLRWADGALTALDHTDPTAEAALIEMGADEPACLRILRHWQAHATDPRILVLAGRHPGDPVVVTPDDLAAAARDLLVEPDPGLRGRAEDRLALLELLSLDPALQRRLQLQIASHLADPDPDPESGAAAVLEAATVGRLAPVVRRWAPGHRVEIVTGQPDVRVDGHGTVVVSAGWHWLAGVWGKYLASVGGFLVLDVERIIEDRAIVIGWGAPRGEKARLTLRGPAPWRVIERADL